MPGNDLITDEEIRELYENDFLPALDPGGRRIEWHGRYTKTLETVASFGKDLTSPDIQRILWEDNGVAGKGMCTIPLGSAIADEGFRRSVSSALTEDLPGDRDAREKHLIEIHQKLKEQCEKHVERTPWVKIMRVVASVHPQAVTCVIDHTRLRSLAKRLLRDIMRGELAGDKLIALHGRILNRIDQALGSPFSSDPAGLAKRSMFAWHLYEVIEREESTGDEPDPEATQPGQEKQVLKFLPQNRRRAGMLVISGYIDTILKMLDFSSEGATVDEVLDFVQEQFPEMQRSTAKTYVMTLRSGLGLLRLGGGVLQVTSLGEKCLDSDTEEDFAELLVPRLLTRIIGFDRILLFLRENPESPRADIVRALQIHYNGWTAQTMPSNLLRWSEELGLVKHDSTSLFSLTDIGEYWAQAVPDDLAPVPVDPPSDPGDESDSGDSGEEEPFQPPSLADIQERIGALPLVFPVDLIARLHLALHSHPHKHFVLLSGLSGTGKTKLAREYANIYHHAEPGENNKYFHLVTSIHYTRQPHTRRPDAWISYANVIAYLTGRTSCAWTK